MLVNYFLKPVAERVLQECSCKPFFITFPLYPNNTDLEEPPACSGIKLACMQVRHAVVKLYQCLIVKKQR
jgi:hypothetical protein